jgi:hypothetical protein
MPENNIDWTAILAALGEAFARWEETQSLPGVTARYLFAALLARTLDELEQAVIDTARIQPHGVARELERELQRFLRAVPYDQMAKVRQAREQEALRPRLPPRKDEA